MARDWTEYNYYFGAETTSDNCYYSKAGGYVKLVPWELKHVNNISTNVSGSSSTIGIPNCPAECVMIYDTGGPIRNFQVSGVRFDAEEDVCNYDFIHQQFNKRTGLRDGYLPFKQGPQYEQSGGFSIGIEWLVSRMQMLFRGYTFRMVQNKIEGVSDTRLEPHTYNVGLTGFSYSFTSKDYSQMAYTLSFSQRVEYSTYPAYKGYVSSFVRQIQSEESND